VVVGGSVGLVVSWGLCLELGLGEFCLCLELGFGEFCLQSSHACFTIFLVIGAVFVAVLVLCVSGFVALGCGNRLYRGLPLAFLGFACDRGVGLAGSVVVLYVAPDVWS
jgi:hypothetical protein